MPAVAVAVRVDESSAVQSQCGEVAGDGASADRYAGVAEFERDSRP
jgi:hypothetical protein